MRLGLLRWQANNVMETMLFDIFQILVDTSEKYVEYPYLSESTTI